MNRVVHFEIQVDDIERAKKFYTESFGWTYHDMGADFGDYVVIMTGPGPEAIGQVLTVENVGINGGMMKRNGPKAAEGSSPNSFTSIIGIKNIEESMQKIEAAGGKPHTDMMDMPNVGKIRYYGDTEGNIFGIIEPSHM